MSMVEMAINEYNTYITIIASEKNWNKAVDVFLEELNALHYKIYEMDLKYQKYYSSSSISMILDNTTYFMNIKCGEVKNTIIGNFVWGTDSDYSEHEGIPFTNAKEFLLSLGEYIVEFKTI